MVTRMEENPPTKMSSLSSSKSILPNLSDDIIIHILNKLPHKSLLRFTAVSKTWKDMIANPNRPDSCYSLRLRSNPSPLIGFFYNNSGTKWRPVDSSTPHIHPSFAANGFVIDASSNGYILFHDKPTAWGSPYRTYYVGNPFTNQQVQLPQVQIKDLKDCPVGFSCRADQSPAHFTVAIPYSDSHDGIWDEISCQHVKVFSSKSVSRWKDIGLKYTGSLELDDYYNSDQLPVFYFKSNTGAVLRDRVFFWMDECENRSVVCDIDQGCYWSMNLPPWEDEFDDVQCELLLVIRDRLFCGRQGSGNWEKIEVWVYEGNLYCYDSNGRWVMNYSVDVLELVRGFPEYMPLKKRSNGNDAADSDNDSYSDDDYGDEMEFSFSGFHPGNPGVVFFTLYGKFMSYEVEITRLRDYGEMGYQENCVACEWLPWPHSLPLVPEASSMLSASIPFSLSF